MDLGKSIGKPPDRVLPGLLSAGVELWVDHAARRRRSCDCLWLLDTSQPLLRGEVDSALCVSCMREDQCEGRLILNFFPDLSLKSHVN